MFFLSVVKGYYKFWVQYNSKIYKGFFFPYVFTNRLSALFSTHVNDTFVSSLVLSKTAYTNLNFLFSTW